MWAEVLFSVLYPACTSNLFVHPGYNPKMMTHQNSLCTWVTCEQQCENLSSVETQWLRLKTYIWSGECQQAFESLNVALLPRLPRFFFTFEAWSCCHCGCGQGSSNLTEQITNRSRPQKSRSQAGGSTPISHLENLFCIVNNVNSQIHRAFYYLCLSMVVM